MWHYQIVKNELGVYSVREVYKTKKGTSWTTDEIAPWGDSRDEMSKCITAYINDILKLPILVVDDFTIVGEESPLGEVNNSEL